ncbi:hypothetical protein [Psychrobacter sp. FDAARGOS_221]|uniref:hypothetical protein n=1 Tax=Psychrobacter sp. FDAARGOS_221 TaxID=1975705 RepID=UPI000BB53BB8|nr:hypothetical protein [Psychrobacter sp. FDAARGOS_221]PNK59591.1 hypothetical protein A6J60_000960 [Psychrobacter sp. FDAARGOS_221]
MTLTITKSAAAATAISTTILMSGCLSVATLGQANKTRYKDTYTTVDSDIIRQMGVLKASQAQSKADSLVLLGDTYAYVLHKGSEQLKMTAKLDANYLQFENPIYVNRALNHAVRSFLQFNYQKPSDNYSQQEVQVLDQFCQRKEADDKQGSAQGANLTKHSNQAYFHCQIYIDGTMYQAPEKLSASVNLKQGQPIVIRQVGTEQYKRRDSLLALPMTAVVDVVTLPFQMIGLGTTMAVLQEPTD